MNGGYLVATKKLELDSKCGGDTFFFDYSEHLCSKQL